ALRLRRLGKGHCSISQDTDFDTTPAKIGMDWAVKMEKPYFVGRTALDRIGKLPSDRKLVSLTFAGAAAPVEGAQLYDRSDRHIGYLTSSRLSPVLGHGVSLGWMSRVDGAFPTDVIAVSEGSRRFSGKVSVGAAYD